MNWDETRARLIEYGVDAARLPVGWQPNIDLHGANLHGANLHGADLRWADLHGADLRWADLCGATLDFAAWPLWCGSLGAIIDDQQAAQLAYHLARVLPESVAGDWVAGLRAFANTWDGIERHGLDTLEEVTP